MIYNNVYKMNGFDIIVFWAIAQKHHLKPIYFEAT